jgi:hypothetical protein
MMRIVLHGKRIACFAVLLLLPELTNAWSESPLPASRRHWIQSLIASSSSIALVGNIFPPEAACSASNNNHNHNNNNSNNNELPLALRDFTKLAPLGKAQVSSTKTYNLSLHDLAARLQHDLLLGATSNQPNQGYILTGDLSTDLFRDDCDFIDPTNRVQSLSQYQQALRILFDPTTSYISLVTPLTVDDASRTITGVYRSRGYLKLPWHPYVTSYESTIQYTIDENGLVKEQRQSWTKSATRALQESFTPSLFAPPPTSQLTTSPNNSEPPVVTELFHRVDGRRFNEYSTMERDEIDSLVDRIIQESKNDHRRQQQQSQPPPQLAGTWRLVYLQPGPGGAGIDRRIPFFPEFPFNDNYQIFSTDHHITNIGELWGPRINVRVMGDYSEEEEARMMGHSSNLIRSGQSSSSSSLSSSSFQRFRATITSGKLCANRDTSCFDLPIAGEGLFDSVYLGDRLRIGQNLNGGGARVVQVRME